MKQGFVFHLSDCVSNEWSKNDMQQWIWIHMSIHNNDMLAANNDYIKFVE